MKLSHRAPKSMQTQIFSNPLTATIAVGSGDLLGCWLLWLCRLILVGCLVIEIKVLASLYKLKGEYEQDRRERDERPSEINKLPCQTLHLHARNLGDLAQMGKQNSQIINNRANLRRLGLQLLGALQHAYQATANFLAMIFGGHKSNKRKQPNEKS